MMTTGRANYIEAGARKLHYRLLAVRGNALFAVLVLNILDVVTTTLALALGGHEANPAVAPFVSSPLALVALKVAVLAVVWWGVRRAPLVRGTTVATWLAGFYTMVVLNNVLVVWRLAH